MKKLGLAILALIAIIFIYYMTIGSKQIVQEMKKEINREVTQLKSSGFAIEKREVNGSREHLVIDFNDTKAIAKYMNKLSRDISEEDIELLKGLKLGLDIEYNPTAKDALALDIYPMELPDVLHNRLKIEDKEEIIKTIKDMVKKREILVHIDINKIASGFEGYIKDINRDFKLKGFKFSGDLDDQKIKNLHQNIKRVSYIEKNEPTIDIEDIKLFISNPTENINNSSTYSIKNLTIKDEKKLSIVLNGISGDSKDKKRDKLVDSSSNFNIVSIDYTIKGERTLLKNISSSINIDNIDMEAFKELNALNIKAKDDKDISKKIIPILKRVISSNIKADIPNISIEKISKNGKLIDGFNLKASAKIDKDFDLKLLDSDPLNITKSIDLKVDIEASNELVNLISSDPRAMVMMMILQPIDKNGKKYYDIRFNNGSLKINGKPLI